MTSPVDAAHVVIPAHQEVALLGRQLDAVGAAVAQAARRWPRVGFSVTVVLDACDDGTADVVARYPNVHPLTVRLQCVGAARSRGIDHARRLRAARAERTWIACTDADSEVSPQWLVGQLEQAASGADLVLGTVRPDDDALSTEGHRRWLSLHRLLDGHPHIHGANMGFRLATYDSVGGFRALKVGEDVDLAVRISDTDACVVRSGSSPVLTSSRLHSRVTTGFASYLLAL